MDVHIDLPIPYKENYQMRMLSHNDIPGLLRVKGSGRDGQSRYTFRVSGGTSMQKEFDGKEMKKKDVEIFVRNLIDTVDSLRNHLLDPDCLLLSPEFIFMEKERYRFCYLPVLPEKERTSLCRAFHEMTEYFVRHLDYQDTEGILFTYKMHKETLRENYELKKIIELCREEEKAWRSEQKDKIEEKEEQENRSGFPEDAVFTVNEDEEESEQESRYKRKTDTEMFREKPAKYGIFKKAVNRIKTGRWGEWEDLITEMDGQEPKGHL